MNELALEKEKIFQTLRDKLQKTAKSEKSFLYKIAPKIQNNASLLAFLTYEDEQSLFDALDEHCKSDFKKAFFFLKAFAEEKTDKFKPQDSLRKRLTTHVCE